MKKKQLTILLAAAAVTVAMRAPAHADDAPSPPTDAQVYFPSTGWLGINNQGPASAPPTYNQIPANYDEFAGVYNKVLAFLRGTNTHSQHKCFPVGTDPNWSHSWCEDVMKWGDPNGRRVAAIELQRDDGTATNEFCLSDDPAEQRCFRSDGKVLDQIIDKKTSVYLTYRVIAGAWNERAGKLLPDLKPHEDANDARSLTTDAPPPAEHTASSDAPYPPTNVLPKNDEHIIPPTYNQIPRDNDEFVEDYNKALAFLRAAGVQSLHKCYPAGSDSSGHGWCEDTMYWSNQNRRHISAVEVQTDNGTVINLICFGDDLDKQRCLLSSGKVLDQTLNKTTNIYLTDREVAGAWNERGKPLPDLKPRAPSPPTAAAPSPPPAAAPSPPPAASVVPPKYNQIPNSYDEFAAAYNKALAFLRDAGTGSIHKCFPAGSDPNDRRGWCQDVMSWVNNTGQHLTAVDTQREDGTKLISLCFGDLNSQRCYRDDGTVFDQSLNRKINIWVTFRRIAGAWNERGKPLADLTPRGKRETKR